MLAHVALSVSDLKRSVDFYARCFDLRCTAVYDYPEKGLTIVMLKKGGLVLELFQFSKRRALPDYRKELASDLRTVGVKHFAVELENIRQVYRRFRQQDVVFATEMRTFDNGARYFFVKDPDGILVEVMEKL